MDKAGFYIYSVVKTDMRKALVFAVNITQRW